MSRAHHSVLATLTLALVAAPGIAQVEPLSSDTVGASPRMVPTPASYAFSLDGDVSLGGSVFKGGYPFLHNDGDPTAYNTAVGLNALVAATPGVPFDGRYNTASGAAALQYNTTGYRNTASGALALRVNTTGFGNTATGTLALGQNTTGLVNAANGSHALRFNTEGYWNTAMGAYALWHNTTGARNIALGALSGTNNTTGSNNIWIAHYGVDPGTESNTLRIGRGTGTGNLQQNRAFISGIANAVGGTFSQDVCVDPGTDQLGPCSGPVAFGQDVEDLGDASDELASLRAVIKAQQAEVAEQQAEIERLRALESEVATLRADRARLDVLTARLARLEALEATREPPALVARR